MAPVRSTQVVVPVKAFRRAKARLAPALSLAERAALAEQMASQVIEVAGPERTWVVCDDDEVAAWARASKAQVSWQPGSGLNGAVAAATTERFTAGATRVVVVHSDLPLISSLAAVEAPGDELILVPDRHGSGTNVVSTPTPAFGFAYGPDSFARHVAEGTRLGLSTVVLRDPALGWDVDDPVDLAVFAPVPTAPGGA